MHSFDSAFHKMLLRKIAEEQSKTISDAGGGALLHLNDVGATAMKYADHVGYLKALEHVKAWCGEIVEDLMKD